MLSADNGIQIGLVSFVPLNCDHPGQTQSAFTAIAPNLGWIRRVMSGRGGNNQMASGTANRPATQVYQVPPTKSMNSVG